MSKFIYSVIVLVAILTISSCAIMYLWNRVGFLNAFYHLRYIETLNMVLIIYFVGIIFNYAGIKTNLNKETH